MLKENEALYLLVNGKYLLRNGKHQPNSLKELLNLLFKFIILDALMADVYEKRKDTDGYLYITYTEENTTGS